MAEWSKAPDSKSGIRQRIGGSNPSLSAIVPLAVSVSRMACPRRGGTKPVRVVDPVRDAGHKGARRLLVPSPRHHPCSRRVRVGAFLPPPNGARAIVAAFYTDHLPRMVVYKTMT